MDFKQRNEQDLEADAAKSFAPKTYQRKIQYFIIFTALGLNQSSNDGHNACFYFNAIVNTMTQKY